MVITGVIENDHKHARARARDVIIILKYYNHSIFCSVRLSGCLTPGGQKKQTFPANLVTKGGSCLQQELENVTFFLVQHSHGAERRRLRAATYELLRNATSVRLM